MPVRKKPRGAFSSAELRSAIKNTFSPDEIQRALRKALTTAESLENPRVMIEIVRLIERVTATTDDDYSPQDWLAAILEKTGDDEDEQGSV